MMTLHLHPWPRRGRPGAAKKAEKARPARLGRCGVREPVREGLPCGAVRLGRRQLESGSRAPPHPGVKNDPAGARSLAATTARTHVGEAEVTSLLRARRRSGDWGP